MFRQLFVLAATLAGFSLSIGGSGLIAQDPGKTVYLQNDQLVVARVKDSNAYLAYGKKAGKWNRFEFPQGVLAVPVLSGGVCAFELTGDAVRELVAVDLKGSWKTIKLFDAAQKCEPIVSEQVAVYMVDGRVYAFSARLGQWDTIETQATPALSRDTAVIVTADSIAVFSVATGKWAVADTSK
jgi:hypothetical protein